MKNIKLSTLFKNCAYNLVPYTQIGDSVNYAFVEKDNQLEIYFEGSNSITDWVRNFMFRPIAYNNSHSHFRVHKGFLDAWRTVHEVIEQKILEKDDNGQFKWKDITIVGYSHGGALSGLCYECVWYHREDLRQEHLRGYGFESPRFYAGFKVKDDLKERWTNYFVIRTNNDIVTHCPPIIFGFTHVGTLLKIKGDTSLVKNKHLKCIKSHYQQVVYDALLKYEGDKK